MAHTPPRQPEDAEYEACPHCTIQIPSNAPVCPHCQQIIARPETSRRRGPGFIGTAAPVVLWGRYGKWVMAAVPVLLALLAVFLAYQRWAGVTLRVLHNPSLFIEADRERQGDVLMIRGTVTNRGDDVPDLSLRSIGVIAEFVYRDGRRERKTAFPKAEFRGEGALLRGETGRFELQGASTDLREIVLWSEIVDLGMERKFITPRSR